MPILWRYLIAGYFRVFFLSVFGFISILLVIRFQEIARFASSGAGFAKVSLFALYQVPYILPIAIPISCLIAAILLFQKLSSTHELTALRAFGLGLKTITFPIILSGTFLSLLNFIVVSEVAPLCRGLSKTLIYEITALNPLLLLQKDTLIKLKNAYVEMRVLNSGKHAEDVVFVICNSSNGRLGIMTAKELTIDGEMLNGKGVTFVSSVDPKREDTFDHLLIENQMSMQTKASHLSPFTQNSEWSSSYEYFPLRMILARELLGKSKSRLLTGGSAQIEICRRVSLGLAAFTFTFVGLCFGIAISRNRSKKGVLTAAVLCSTFMICFLVAKSMRHAPLASCAAYLLPHPLIILLSLRTLTRISEGRE